MSLLEVKALVKPILKSTLIFRSIKKRGIEDLNDECLKVVFKQMTLKQKFAIERVSKRWQTLLNEEFDKQTGFTIGSISEESQQSVAESRCSDDSGKHHSKDEIRDTTKVWIESLAKKMPNIKSIVFRVDMNGFNFLWIKSHFRDLECIDLLECNLKIRNVFVMIYSIRNTVKHLSIRCNLLSNDCVLELLVNLHVLEELQISKFSGPLDPIFQRIRLGIKRVSLEECAEFGVTATNALTRLNSSLIDLEIKDGWNMAMGLEILHSICTNFANLKSFQFAKVHPQITNLTPLNQLTQLQHLKLTFFYGRTIDWTQGIREMKSLKSLGLVCGQLTPAIVMSMSRIWPNLEKLSIDYPQNTLRCVCEGNKKICEKCVFETYKEISKLKELRTLEVNQKDDYVNRRGRFEYKYFKTIVKYLPSLSGDAFPSLQRVKIGWTSRSFPRLFKRPLYDGLVFLAKRNAERVVILEIREGLDSTQNQKIKKSWFSVIGRYRLSKNPSNLKFMFLSDNL